MVETKHDYLVDYMDAIFFEALKVAGEFRMADRQREAQDATQMTLEKVMRTYGEGQAPWAYLKKTVRNALIDRVRRECTVENHLSSYRQSEAISHEPRESVLDIASIINDVLSVRERELLVLSAYRVVIDSDADRMALSRARHKVREHLSLSDIIEGR